jgi:hypothetical protein
MRRLTALSGMLFDVRDGFGRRVRSRRAVRQRVRGRERELQRPPQQSQNPKVSPRADHARTLAISCGPSNQLTRGTVRVL